MARRKKHPPKVVTPKADGPPPWARIGLFSVVGLVVGMGWPSLAGIRIGPEVPGSKKASAPIVAAAVSAKPTPSAAPKLAKPKPAVPISKKQRVVVSGGEIRACYKGKDQIKGDCGRLSLDKVIVPRLEELTGCPAVIGLSGHFDIGFDVQFKKKEIKVLRGDKGELPGSTINAIVRCVADFLSDVDPDKIKRKHSRYKVFYGLDFHPPGTALPTRGTDDAPEGESDEQRALAAVSWDTALVRAEPETGKVIARLVRGTRVKILGRRKDWYRVKIRQKEGWVYRGALGM